MFHSNRHGVKRRQLGLLQPVALTLLICLFFRGSAPSAFGRLQAAQGAPEVSREERAEMLKQVKGSFLVEHGDRCPGCGAKLQTENPRGLGYVPAEHVPKATRSGRLTVDEEVALLMQEEGLEDEDKMTQMHPGTFRVVANVFLEIRKNPDINSELVGEHLSFGDLVDVREVMIGSDGRTYLKLSNGKGWIFDWTEMNGERVMLVESETHPKRRAATRSRDRRAHVCMRCWHLWQYNDCDDFLRPSHEAAGDELSPETFREMLSDTLQGTTGGAVVLAVVDVFDFGSSYEVLEYLAEEVKDTSKFIVKIVANKLDLLPDAVNPLKVQTWMQAEAHRAGIRSLQLRDILPVSCHKPYGLSALSRMLEDETLPRKFILVGAANTGKSSLINRLSLRKRKGVGAVEAMEQDGFTVSVLPGTTLSTQTVNYRRGRARILDTPGLLMGGNLQDRLTMEDLRLLIPQNGHAHRVTVSLDEGRSWLIGGLARIEFLEGRPFQFTAFTSQDITLHRCKTAKVDANYERLIGTELTPPLLQSTFEQLAPWRSETFEVVGRGWDEACCDVVLPGVGFISVTGSGAAKFAVYVPEGVDVALRQDPLMPHEARWTGVKSTAPGWYNQGGRRLRARKEFGNPKRRQQNKLLKKRW